MRLVNLRSLQLHTHPHGILAYFAVIRRHHDAHWLNICSILPLVLHEGELLFSHHFIVLALLGPQGGVYSRLMHINKFALMVIVMPVYLFCSRFCTSTDLTPVDKP